MSTPAYWNGFKNNFLDGFVIQIPELPAEALKDLVINSETSKPVFDYMYYSAIVCKSRKMPFYSASNMYRENWVSAGREGTFIPDARAFKEEQLTTTLYTELNKKHAETNKKVDKGHLTRREDVQWDKDGDENKAIEAAKATFFYTNACPQHHELNNEIWKYLENSVLARGRSKKPLKAIVFTGPIFSNEDPLLVFPTEIKDEIKCPLRFWKVIYYVNDKNELRCAAFIMSQKELMERDGHIKYPIPVRGMMTIEKKEDKPFLLFEENEKYQVTLKLLNELTGIKFTKAIEGLTEEQEYSKLTAVTKKNVRGMMPIMEEYSNDFLPFEIDGLKL